MRAPTAVVVVGAGHGGAAAVTLLRQSGYDGSLTLVGEEPHLPYDRPPLSKGLTSGTELGQPLHSKEYYDENAVDLRLECRAVSIDRDEKVVELDTGSRLGYDALILATGSRARDLPLPGASALNVRRLRGLDEARSLRAELAEGSRLVVLGGGWIGLEVAASAAEAGVLVTVVEREPQLLARVASGQLAAALRSHYAEWGIEVITGAVATTLETGDDRRVHAVLLDDGRRLPCDVVLVAVGATPNTELAAAAGLVCRTGVVVDEVARTSDPSIYAIGDIALQPDDHGAEARHESIHSVTEQAQQAVAHLLRREPPPTAVPWFWSDQRDLKIRMAGHHADADDAIVLSSGSGHDLVALHVREGRLVGVETINAAAEFVLGRNLIGSREPFDADRFRPVRRSTDEGHAPLAGEQPEPTDSGQRWSVTFDIADGDTVKVPVESGQSLMQAAVAAKIPGILAECGGNMACGTCHVLVDADWIDRLAPAGEEERGLIEYLDGSGPTSRLSCQIRTGSEADGLRVEVPHR